MKIIILTSLGLAATLLPSFSQPATDAQLRSANVTLPYEELKRLLEIAHHKNTSPPQPPPMAAALKSAQFRVRAQSGQAILQAEAEFRVINLSGKWEWTPLISGSQIESITPADAMVVKRDGVIGLLHREPGTHQVSLEMSGPSLQFTPAEASSCQLALAKAPEGQRWQVEGHSRRLSESRHALDQKEVTVSLQTVVTEVDSEWALRSEIAIETKPLQLSTQARLSLHTSSGTARRARIQLPTEATEVQIQGSDLMDWSLSHDHQGQWLNINWKTPRILNRSIQLSYQLPAPADGGRFTLTGPVLNKGTSYSVIAMAPTEGVEITTALADRRLPAAKLPLWIAAHGRSSEWVAQEGEGPQEFELRFLPRAKTAEATIHRAAFDMNVVGEGSLLCTANFIISHRGASRWEFQLPENSTLLSCTRNGEAARPIIAGEQQLTLHLPAASGHKEHQTQVTMMYTAKIDAMDPVEGAIALTLPSTPLFIQETHWLVRIPDHYRSQAIEGNLQIVPTKNPTDGINLRKFFNHGEAPTARIHYRKRSVKD